MQTLESVNHSSVAILNKLTLGVILTNEIANASDNRKYQKVMVAVPSGDTSDIGKELCTSRGFNPVKVGITLTPMDGLTRDEMVELAKAKGVDALYIDSGLTSDSSFVPSGSKVFDQVTI